MLDTLKVPAGQTGKIESQLFAGAKQMKILQAYQNTGILQFDLLIDWGWFFFITKPLFQLMEAINSVVHNFGVTILILTVLVRLAFFPLANKQLRVDGQDEEAAAADGAAARALQGRQGQAAAGADGRSTSERR